MELRCQAVKEWLDRSGSCSLSLSIAYPFDYAPHFGSDKGEDDDDVACPPFQIIHPSAPRWEHLHLSMPLSIYRKLETKIPIDSLSRLQGFTGNILSPGPPPGAPPTLTLLHNIELPSLESRGDIVTKLSTTNHQPRPLLKLLESTYRYMF
jgi:hypothetical protein